MGGSRRKMQRARARALRPELREIAPGVYDLALPVPPGMPEADVRAAFERFRRTVLVELGLELAAPHICTPETCSHSPNPTPTHEQE